MHNALTVFFKNQNADCGVLILVELFLMEEEEHFQVVFVLHCYSKLPNFCTITVLV